VASAQSTIGYLRMVTPRVGRGLGPEEPKGGRTRIVYRDGEAILEGEAGKLERARYSTWHGGNLDPDAVARHQSHLQKLGFMNNLHAKGGAF
jgi:hypothetical protein